MKYRILILLLLFSAALYPQTRKQLENQKKKLNEEIRTTTKLINQTLKSRKGAENRLVLTKQSIKQGEQYITLLNDEINMLNHDIDSIEAARVDFEKRLEYLRMQYAADICLLYRQSKRNSFSNFIFIVSAEDLNEGFRRYRYLQQVSIHRRLKAIEIKEIADTLAAQELALTNSREQKEVAMSERERQQKKLERQQRSQDQQIKNLKQKESELKKKQQKQQNQIAALERKIQDAINAEMEEQQRKKGAAKPSESSSKKSTSSASFEMSKEEKLIAGNFAANRGKLPRPVERGNITGHFGVQPHPYLEKVTVNNKGIYIQSPAGTDARAVFEGVVTKVFAISGSNQSVIIRHGNYSTVYSNLSSVYVKAGDKVTTKQKIGKIYTDPEDGNKTELYFLMYQDKNILNPENWLAR